MTNQRQISFNQQLTLDWDQLVDNTDLSNHHCRPFGTDNLNSHYIAARSDFDATGVRAVPLEYIRTRFSTVGARGKFPRPDLIPKQIKQHDFYSRIFIQYIRDIR